MFVYRFGQKSNFVNKINGFYMYFKVINQKVFKAFLVQVLSSTDIRNLTPNMVSLNVCSWYRCPQ